MPALLLSCYSYGVVAVAVILVDPCFLVAPVAAIVRIGVLRQHVVAVVVYAL